MARLVQSGGAVDAGQRNAVEGRGCRGGAGPAVRREVPVISATATVGLLRLQLSPADDKRALTLVEQVREVAARHGGFAIVDAASDGVKQQIDVFGPARTDIEIMRRLKAELDPKGVLSPGRLWGRI